MTGNVNLPRSRPTLWLFFFLGALDGVLFSDILSTPFYIDSLSRFVCLVSRKPISYSLVLFYAFCFEIGN